jgi:hypothetical protein
MLPTTYKSPADFRKALAQFSPNEIGSTSTSGGAQYVKFLSKQDGSWTYGADQTEITEPVLLNAATIQKGWMAWLNGRAEKRLVHLLDEYPEIPDARATDENGLPLWRNAVGVDFAMKDGTMLRYESSTQGASNAIAGIVSQIQEQAQKGDYFYPKIRLGTTPAKVTTGGRTRFPVLEVIEWCDENGLPKQDALPKQDVTEGPDSEAPVTVRRTRRARARA